MACKTIDHVGSHTAAHGPKNAREALKNARHGSGTVCLNTVLLKYFWPQAKKKASKNLVDHAGPAISKGGGGANGKKIGRGPNLPPLTLATTSREPFVKLGGLFVARGPLFEKTVLVG